MADYDYSRKLGVRGVARPTQGPAAELWKRTRDEILRDHNRLDSLPPEIRALVMPGGRRPDGEYEDALALAARLERVHLGGLGPVPAAVGQPGGRPAHDQGKVDTFTRQRAGEHATLQRIRGTERLYDLLVRFNVARNELGMKPEQYTALPRLRRDAGRPVRRGLPRYRRLRERAVALFPPVRGPGNEIALEALAASERAVQDEIVRYRGRDVLARLFDDLAPCAPCSSMTSSRGGRRRGQQGPHPGRRSRERTPATGGALPSLADPELETRDIAAATPEALGAALRANDDARLKNIHDTRTRIANEPGAVLQFDRVRDLTRQELGAEDKTVGWRVVQSHLDEVANRERFNAQAQMLVAIGFGMLTFGSGTLVVLGAAGDFAISAFQAHDEWERYQAAQAAAHSALDPDQTLSSQDPSGVWFALALIAAGFSAKGLTKELTTAGRAIAVLERTGDLAKFRAALDQARELTPGVRAALDRSGQAYADFKAEWWALVGRSTANMAGGVNVASGFKAYVLLARHLARMGVRRFDVFLETLKARKELAAVLRAGEFTAEEEKQIKAAFAQGVREYDATRPVIRVPFSKRERIVTFRDETLLDGKPITMRDREAVMHRLGLRHTDWGHGVHQDPVVLAQQAVDSAIAGDEGMISQWASDEAMLGNLQRAQAEVVAGRGVRQANGKFEVVLPATPDAGRVYVANSRLGRPWQDGDRPQLRPVRRQGGHRDRPQPRDRRVRAP